MLLSNDHTPSPDARRLPVPDRSLSVTPLDLRQAKFKTTIRGFDRAEVTAFLLEAADGFEHAMRDNDRLRQELMRLEAALNQHRELEGTIKATLMSAQKVADDMREHAQQEAARIVREAEGRAELLIERAQARLEDVKREIDGLQLKRREAEAGLESIITALRHTLEFIRGQDRRESRALPNPSTLLGTGPSSTLGTGSSNPLEASSSTPLGRTRPPVEIASQGV